MLISSILTYFSQLVVLFLGELHERSDLLGGTLEVIDRESIDADTGHTHLQAPVNHVNHLRAYMHEHAVMQSCQRHHLYPQKANYSPHLAVALLVAANLIHVPLHGITTIAILASVGISIDNILGSMRP